MTQFWAKIAFWAKFGQLFVKIIAQKVALKHPKKSMKMLFWGPVVFRSWQFSYLVILVPEKVQSGSCQNKKLRTLVQNKNHS